MLLFCFARFCFTTGTNSLQTGLNASINFVVINRVFISTSSFFFVRLKSQHLKKIWTKQPYMIIRVSLVKNRMKVTDIHYNSLWGSHGQSKKSNFILLCLFMMFKSNPEVNKTNKQTILFTSYTTSPVIRW